MLKYPLFVLRRFALAAVAGIALVGCGSGGNFSATTAAGAPVLAVSPASLSFGSVATGYSSGNQTVTVSNTGTGSLVVSNISISGNFAQSSSGCGSSLGTGATCIISVSFTPSSLGVQSGTLTVTSNASSTPLTVALSGTGVVPMPMLSLSATSVTFGAITNGMSSAPWMITATNTGDAPLAVSSVVTSGQFVQSSSCPATLAPDGSCQIGITFSPTTAGSLSGTTVFTSNTAVSPQTVSLRGTGAAPASYAGAPFQVQVQAGTKPISGASVQFYAAGTTGNGSAPTSLLSAALVTNPAGIVSIPAGFVCPAAASPVYLISRGGIVSGTTSANANIVLMSAIGACNAISTGSKFLVDEATTVSAAYALAAFYSVGGSIGATASNLIGLSNAFATAATLADPVAGTSPGSTLPSNAASPAARVNTVANLLNACTASSAACTALYTSTAPGSAGSTVATNTLDAVYDLATHPAANVTALYMQSLASSAYSPSLQAAPTDWTMFLNYSGGGMNNPSGIGVDSQGSVWVASYFNVASKFSPIGTAVFPGGITGSGLDNSYGLAIDLSDNVWIPNEQPFTAVGIGSVTELNSAGVALSGPSGYISGGLDYPLSVAIDPNGTVWVVDYGDSYVTLLSPSGVPLSGTSGYTSSLFEFPVAVAVDANHFGWIVNESSDDVTKVAPDGSAFVNYSCCNLASGIAIDQGDNVWVADYFGNSVSLLTNFGSVISSDYTAAGSIDHPQGIAIDGAGSAWVANYRAAYLSELSGSTSKAPGSALSPVAGLGADAGLLEAYAIAVDASGNIWVSNQGNNTLTKFIGLAVPVKTPLSGLPQLP